MKTIFKLRLIIPHQKPYKASTTGIFDCIRNCLKPLETKQKSLDYSSFAQRKSQKLSLLRIRNIAQDIHLLYGNQQLDLLYNSFEKT